MNKLNATKQHSGTITTTRKYSSFSTKTRKLRFSYMQQQQEWGKESSLVGTQNNHIPIPGMVFRPKTVVKSILLYLKPFFHKRQTKIFTGQPNMT
eukprot:sb/3479302/